MQSSKKILKVLILYTKVGGGHESIAYGLKERLEEVLGERIEITLSDPTNSSTGVAYQLGTTISPELFNMSYNLLNSPIMSKIWRGVQSFIHEDELHKTIRTVNPDLIISTYFLLSEEVKKVLRHEHLDVPLVVYIADPFTPHSIWIAKDIDLYLSFDLDHLPSSKQVPDITGNVIPVGMPIRRAFYKTYNKKETYESVGFDPEKFTIFFGGSGHGMDHLERVAQKYKEDLSATTQALFFTGRNPVLRRALKVLFRNCPNVHVFGYVQAEEMASYMQIADVFVGKVGPNAMFETVLSGLIPIATPPILEQERGNRDFIEKEGIGFLAKNASETLELLEKLAQDKTLLLEPQKRLSSVRKILTEREKKGFPQFIEWIEKRCFKS